MTVFITVLILSKILFSQFKSANRFNLMTNLLISNVVLTLFGHFHIIKNIFYSVIIQYFRISILVNCVDFCIAVNVIIWINVSDF